MKKALHIVVLGAGKVGRVLARDLVAWGQNVRLMDIDSLQLTKIRGKLDVALYEGDAGDFALLREVFQPHVDVCIAVTAHDEVNMMACLVAKEMGCRWTVARVRDEKYDRERAFLENNMRIDRIINPEGETASLMRQTIEHPRARRVESFFEEDVQLIEIQLEEGDQMCGKSLAQMDIFRQSGVLVAMLGHHSDLRIPESGEKLQADDILTLLGRKEDLQKVLHNIHQLPKSKNRLLIVGGGRLTIRLLKELEDRMSQIKVIELDATKAEKLARLFPEVDVILGDGSDAEFLDQEHLSSYDHLAVLTGIDEENILTAVYGRRQGVKRAMAKVDRRALAHLIPAAERPVLFSPKDIIADQILQQILHEMDREDMHVDRLARFPHIPLQTIELALESGDALLKAPLKELSLKDQVLIAIVKRGDRTFIPGGEDQLEAGDRVIAILPEGEIRQGEDLLKKESHYE